MGQPADAAGLGGSMRGAEVLETATRLFTERGYDAASIRDLAAELEMRPSSLYHHFPGKQQILFAICFGMQSDFNAIVMPLFRTGKGPVATIREVIRQHILFGLSRRGEVLVNMRERRSLPPEELARVNALRRQYRDAVAAVILKGRRQGQFAVRDPKLATMAIMDMVSGLFQWFDSRNAAEVEQIAAVYADAVVALLRGWGRKSPG